MYSYYPPSNCFTNTQKVWYTHINGKITRSTIDPSNNRVIQKSINYNHPNETLKFLDEYFRYKLK